MLLFWRVNSDVSWPGVWHFGEHTGSSSLLALYDDPIKPKLGLSGWNHNKASTPATYLLALLFSSYFTDDYQRCLCFVPFIAMLFIATVMCLQRKRSVSTTLAEQHQQLQSSTRVYLHTSGLGEVKSVGHLHFMGIYTHTLQVTCISKPWLSVRLFLTLLFHYWIKNPKVTKFYFICCIHIMYWTDWCNWWWSSTWNWQSASIQKFGFTWNSSCFPSKHMFPVVLT